MLRKYRQKVSCERTADCAIFDVDGGGIGIGDGDVGAGEGVSRDALDVVRREIDGEFQAEEGPEEVTCDRGNADERDKYVHHNDRGAVPFDEFHVHSPSG